MASKEIFFGHSSDVRYAFMFYALARNKIKSDVYKIIHIFQDVQILNERAVHSELDITAISIHAYSYIKRKYILMRCGTIMARESGPVVVSKYDISPNELPNKIIAIPGTMTSEFLALRIAIGDFDYCEEPADKILQQVQTGQVDAGLIMQESDMTYESLNLYNVLDVGKWWLRQTQLPLALMGIAISRSLGNCIINDLCKIFRQCIAYSLDNFDEAIEYAMNFNQNLDRKEIDKTIRKYVDKSSLDVEDTEKKAITMFLSLAEQRKLIPPTIPIDFAPRF